MRPPHFPCVVTLVVFGLVSTNELTPALVSCRGGVLEWVQRQRTLAMRFQRKVSTLPSSPSARAVSSSSDRS